jgi:hypothetical protein
MAEEEPFDYYAPRPLGGGQPIGIFRFPKEGDRPPDRFVPGRGWVEDKWILLKMMSGELGPPDQVSFDEAKLLLAMSLSGTDHAGA